MKKLLGISLVAMMAVTTARADIASKAYVDQQDDAVEAIVGALSDLTDAGFTAADKASVAKAANAAMAKANTAAGDLSNYELLSNVTSKGSATQPVYFDASGVATPITNPLGTAAAENVATSIAENGTGLATSAQVWAAVDAVSDAVDGLGDLAALDEVDSATIKNGSVAEEDLATALATKINDKADASDLADYELLDNVTSKGSATQPVYFDANGVATPITNPLGTAAAENVATSIAENGTGLATSAQVYTAINSANTTALDALDLTNAQATGNGVVTQVTQTNGQIAVTKDDPLTTMGYTELENDVEGDGQYVLTMKKNGTAKEYKWEMIERAGN